MNIILILAAIPFAIIGLIIAYYVIQAMLLLAIPALACVALAAVLYFSGYTPFWLRAPKTPVTTSQHAQPAVASAPAVVKPLLPPKHRKPAPKTRVVSSWHCDAVHEDCE